MLRFVRRIQGRKLTITVLICECQMTKKRTRILVAISNHLLLGDLSLQDSRIRETLNNSSTDFVQLHNVEVYTHVRCECVTKLPAITVSKSKLEFIVVPLGPHEARDKCWNNWSARAAHDAYAFVNGYRIRGTLHLPESALDPQLAFMQQDGRFFALTNVSLGYGGRGVRPLEVPLLLANKELVSSYRVGSNIDSEVAEVAQDTTLGPQYDVAEEDTVATLLENIHGLLTVPNGEAEVVPSLPTV